MKEKLLQIIFNYIHSNLVIHIKANEIIIKKL